MGKKEQVPALAMFVQGSLSKCSKNLTFFAARGPVFECCATKRTSPVGARSTHSGAQASSVNLRQGEAEGARLYKR